MPKTKQKRNSAGYVGQHLPQGRIYFHIYVREVSLEVLTFLQLEIDRADLLLYCLHASLLEQGIVLLRICC